MSGLVWGCGDLTVRLVPAMVDVSTETSHMHLGSVFQRIKKSTEPLVLIPPYSACPISQRRGGQPDQALPPQRHRGDHLQRARLQPPQRVLQQQERHHVCGQLQPPAQQAGAPGQATTALAAASPAQTPLPSSASSCLLACVCARTTIPLSHHLSHPYPTSHRPWSTSCWRCCPSSRTCCHRTSCRSSGCTSSAATR